MAHLTEERIIEITHLFLRHRYKYYPHRTSAIELQSRMRGQGGLSVDGIAAFERDEGRMPKFKAAVEATDFFKRDELWYQVYWSLAVWDALSVSTLLLSFVFVWMHLSGNLTTFKGNPFFLAGMGALLLVITTFALYRLLLPRRRYRYIYAIEQFKAYEATEQWVAFAWDVFPGYEHPLFLELREQCVINGLGLLEITREESIKMHLSPAREGMPKRTKRRVVALLTEREWALALQKQVQAVSWKNSLRKLLPQGTGSKNLDDLLRFQRPIRHQAGMLMLSIAITLAVLIREYGQRPVIYENEDRYQQKMLLKADELERQKEAYYIPVVYDTQAIVPFNSAVQPYLALIPEPLPPWEIQAQSMAWFMLKGDAFTGFPCDVAQQQLSGKFVVTAGNFFDLEYMKSILRRLKVAGLNLNGLWGGCFFDRRNYFMLVSAETYDAMETATQAADRVNRTLLQEGLIMNVRVTRLE